MGWDFGSFDWIGQAADNIVGYFGQQESQDFSNQTREQTENFQRQMRATQYQTAVADMSKAGLNPMLAYSQGGSGNLSGAGGGGSPSMPGTNYGQAMSTASQVQVNRGQAELLKAQVGKTEAERQEIIARTPTYSSSIAHTQSSAKQIDQLVDYLKWVNPERIQQEQQESVLQAFRRQEQHARSSHFKEYARNESLLGSAHIRKILAEAALTELDEPGARARASRDETWYGQNVRPYLDEIGKVAGSAAGGLFAGKAIGALRRLPFEKGAGPRRRSRYGNSISGSPGVPISREQYEKEFYRED